MASKRQMRVEIKKLEDMVAFERAKVEAGIKILEFEKKLATGEYTTGLRLYWTGYWKGKEDGETGRGPSLPPK